MRSYSISQRKKSRGNLTWYGRTFEDGTLVSEVSLKTTRKADAKAWLDAMNASRFVPEAFRKTEQDREIGPAVESFLTSVSTERGPKSATYRAYRSRLKSWVEWCGRKKITALREFTRELAVEFSGETAGTDSTKTAHERIRLMRQFFAWCAETFGMEGWDPMKTVKPPKVAKRSKTFWTPEQVDAILDHAPDALFRLFWALMAFAGLRHAEALSFGASSIVDGRLRIVGKGNKEAFVPIGKRLEEEFRRVEVSDGMFAGKRFRTSERCMMHLRRAVKACGLDPADATNHKFRHSFASNLIRSGANVKAVQQLMRHESVDITLDTYSHLLQDDLKASVDIL